MTHRFVLILFLAAASVSAQSTVDQLYAARQYELADAYWSAGQKFIDLGQADRGAEFKAHAKKLFPGYVPGQAPAVNPMSMPTSTPQLPATEVVREKNIQGEKVVRLQFQKLLRGYLTGSAGTMAAALNDSVEVQGKATTPTAESLAAFLQAHPAEAGSPDELFELDSLDITSSGQTVTLTVKANPQAPGLGNQVRFWKEQQTYVFDRVGDTWKLTAVSGE